MLRSDPAKAATILNDNPRDVGRVLGEAAATAAMAKLDTGGKGCSFDADTPVATLDGNTAIGDLAVGDTVLAFNEATGMLEADPITHVWVNHDPAIAFLTIDGAQLDTTPEHPFFTSERGWVPAGDLQLGEHVRRLDGSVGVVESLRIEARPVVMYNLTVARAHTFFVGEDGWLVHNSCGPYEVGTYKDLKARSTSGDNLEIHHVPQKHPAAQVIKGYDPDTGSAIALPVREHKAIPRARGTYPGTSQSLIADDLANLRRFTNAPASAIRDLIDLIDTKYPGAR